MSDDPTLLSEKWPRLRAVLGGYRRVAVAFSGGVDSALLCRAAVKSLGPEAAIAVTAESPSLASGELARAREAAAEIGIRHRVIATGEFESAGYRANAGDRCFYCKDELYTALGRLLPELGVDVICNGANLDDRDDHRPGMRAAVDHRVKSPLIEAAFTKRDVRALARLWRLTVWNKPASPCLSSRIAYGVEATAERVQRVDRAEQFLRERFGECPLRVRLEANELARIELPAEALGALADPAFRAAVVERLRDLGFRYVTVDLEGFRSGSLNAALPLVSLEVGGHARGNRMP